MKKFGFAAAGGPVSGLGAGFAARYGGGVGSTPGSARTACQVRPCGDKWAWRVPFEAQERVGSSRGLLI